MVVVRECYCLTLTLCLYDVLQIFTVEEATAKVEEVVVLPKLIRVAPIALAVGLGDMEELAVEEAIIEISYLDCRALQDSL